MNLICLICSPVFFPWWRFSLNLKEMFPWPSAVHRWTSVLPFLGVLPEAGEQSPEISHKGFSVGIHEVDRAGKGRLGVLAPCLHLWLHLLHSSFPGPWEFLQQAIFIPSLGPFRTSTILFAQWTFAHLSGFNPNHAGLDAPNRASPVLSLGALTPPLWVLLGKLEAPWGQGPGLGRISPIVCSVLTV